MAGNNVIASALNAMNEDLLQALKRFMTWKTIFKIKILDSCGTIPEVTADLCVYAF
jgi:hypothetical protein